MYYGFVGVLLLSCVIARLANRDKKINNYIAWSLVEFICLLIAFVCILGMFICGGDLAFTAATVAIGMIILDYGEKK